jgi:hypothetical protein
MSKGRPQLTLTLEYVGPPEWYSMRLKALLKVLLRTLEFRCVKYREGSREQALH